MKQKFKIIIDIVMTVLLFALNGYQFFSESLHEWLGIMIFICFVIHNILNFNWYKSLNKGKYSKIRVLYCVTDLMVLVSMMVQMYSGIAMSRSVFSFLDFHANISMVRRLHILGAYWGFLLIGVHLGLHWNGLLRKIEVMKLKQLQKLWLLTSSLFAIYGIYAFMKRNFTDYLFLKSEFVFMDFNELPFLFYFDYLAILGLCIYVSHYGMKLLSGIQHREKAQSRS